MDPNAALRTMRAAVTEWQTGEENNLSEQIDGLMEAIDALDTWLTNGGFVPTEWER